MDSIRPGIAIASSGHAARRFKTIVAFAAPVLD